MTPLKFRDLVEKQQWTKIANAVVQGRVNLAGLKFDHPVALRGLTFEGDVDLSDCAFDGSVLFDNCSFARNLDLSNSRIQGSLEFQNVTIKGGSSPTGRRFQGQYPFNGNGIEVAGDLSLRFVDVTYGTPRDRPAGDGSISLVGAKVGGNFSFVGCALDGHLTFDNATIDADLTLGTIFDPARSAIVKGYFGRGIYARNIKVEGGVFLQGLLCGGDAVFWGSRFQSTIFLSSYADSVPGSSGSKLEIIHSDIFGELNFAAARIDGYLQIESTRIGGAVNLLSTQAAAVRLRYYTSAGDAEPERRPCSIGQLILQNTIITADISLYGLIVTGSQTGTRDEGILISGAKIGSDLRMWSGGMLVSEEEIDRAHLDAFDHHAVISGDIKIDGNTEIGGELDLTNTIVNGSIAIKDSHITGDVKIRSNVTLLDEPPSQMTLRAAEEGMSSGRLLQARARSLNLSMLTCDNDIDLTGLSLETPDHKGHAGGIRARDLSVKGKVELVAVYATDSCLFQDQDLRDTNYTVTTPDEQGKKWRHVAYCSIPGFADFSGVKAGIFQASAHSFDNEAACESDLKQCGLRLASAEIWELLIIDVRPGEVTRSGHKVEVEGDFFPVPIDLGEVKVEVWSIGKPDRPRAERYLRLLSNDKRLRRSTYRNVELRLRNRGHEEDADTIYRAMKERTEGKRREDARGRWHWLSEHLGALNVALVASLLGVIALDSTTHGHFDWREWFFGGLWQSTSAYFSMLGVASIIPPIIVALLFARTRHYAYKYALGFGTEPLRVLLLIFLVWAAMLPGYSQHGNYEPSPTALARTDDPPIEGASPKEINDSLSVDAVIEQDEWPVAAALFSSFNHHVPMISLLVRQDWELKDSDTFIWRIRLGSGLPTLEAPKWVFGTITPEDWGVLMSVINWIMWPLVLTFLIRKAVRGRSE